MVQIKQIDIASAFFVGGMLSGLLTAALGLIRLLAYVLLPDSLLTLPIYYNPPGTVDPAQMELGFAALNYLLGILVLAAGGALTGAVLAFVYNVVARRFGGLKLHIS